MKRLATAALFLASAVVAHGQDSAELTAAARPLADGVPQVAVVRLRNLLERELPEAERSAASEKLAEALIAAGQPTEALPILAEPAVAQRPAATFLAAQANAALGRWPEALASYQRTRGMQNSPFRSEAHFGEATVLRALGKIDDALKVLDALRGDERWSVRARFRSVELLIEKNDTAAATRLLGTVQTKSTPERKERRFLRGSIALAQNNRSSATELFGSILKAPEGAPHSVLIATLMAMAEAHLQSKTPANGDDFLEDFIEHHPTDEELPAIFAKLDQLYAAERRQSRHELGRWANEEAEPRRALSLWYLARAELRLGHPELALQAFQQLQQNRPSYPLVAEAALEHAQLEAERGRFDEALKVLDEARARRPAPLVQERIEMLRGAIEYQAKRFTTAAQTFRQVANSDSPLARDALYDVSLGWLQGGNAEQFAAATKELAQQSGDAKAPADLLLEQGLVQASRGESEAGATLQKFLRDFPQHERAAEAWVALAELAFHATPRRLEEAVKDLQNAADAHPGVIASERGDYLSIWIADATPDSDDGKLIGLATQYLQRYPASPRLPDVRLKLAETYFRRQDFPAAQTQFELLAQQNPDSPAAEKAQFFAAQAATQSMAAGSLQRALTLFDAVVKRNGELKWAARNEQAVIERKLGKPQDALTLYDEVSRSDAKPGEKREALCGKADIFYEIGATDPTNYRRAIELYDELAAQKDASAHWRNQALFKKGMCLEKLDAPADALATFYRIVEDDTRPERQREFFWFYKAGFNAARLLEEQSKWQPAAAIYEKLAFAGGGRSEEAKSRLNRLRLEHFLWQQ